MSNKKQRTKSSLFFICAYTKLRSDEKLMIKGYVKDMYQKKVPVTWERETKKYVYNVRKVMLEQNNIQTSKRLFEDKMPKSEIIHF